MTTAVRIHKGSKIFVRVTFDDGESVDCGGKRAERAMAVLVTQFKADEGQVGVYGLRSSLSTAQQEAHRLVTADKRQLRSSFRGGATRYIPITPYHYAEAVLVTEEGTN